jgi:ADP-heptose:LPS heptosyltransferase
MPSVRFLLRRASDRMFGTAFDRALEGTPSSGTAFLFFWNRGMGDIALGLVPLFARIRRERPGSRIAVITRAELEAPFAMTDADEVHVLEGLEREARVDIGLACARLGLAPGDFDAVFDYPDPNRWLSGRRTAFPPRLAWKPAWDPFADAVLPREAGCIAIGAHVHSETAAYYGYGKDWPAERWRELMARLSDRKDVRWLLFGQRATPGYESTGAIDLRGKTDFPTLMSVIRNRCRVLVVPDSGILTMAYYLDQPFDLDVVSLWSDPRQGVLLQGCASPNPRLRHAPLLAPGEDLANLEVDTVEAALRSALDRIRT